MSLALLTLLLLSEPAPVAVSKGTPILFVDVEKAIDKSKKGEALRRKLHNAINTAATLGLDSTEALIERSRQELEQPFMAELPSLPLDVLRLDQVPILDPPPECDRSASYALRIDGGEGGFEPAPPVCHYQRFFSLDFDRALANSALAKAAIAELERFKAARQQEVDQAKAARDKKRDEKERAAMQALLDRAFEASQKALAERERATEQKLEARLLDILLELRRGHPGSLVIDLGAEKPLLLAPRCDVTAWASARLDGTAPSPTAGCGPAFRGARE